MKLAIAVRKDLGMGAGKVAVQVAHAAIIAYRAGIGIDPVEKWFLEGQHKIVLKVQDQAALETLERRAKEGNVPSHRVVDFGLTQIPANTWTCLGIGIDENLKVDIITEGLKLW